MNRGLRSVAAAASLACFAALLTPALAQNPVSGDNSGGGGVQWLYDSPLCVVETITDAGGGRYEYSYEFENVDTANLWHFGVWSDFSSVVASATWGTHPEWSYSQAGINDVLPAYDGRNLDPAILYLANTWGPNYPNTPDPIVPGETVSGFSYIAPGFDDSPKWYFYETIESGYTQENGGFVAAVGQTCDEEPVAVRQMTWGRIRMMYK